MGIFKKYGKKILATRDLTIDNELITCLILDDESGKYWNVHIIMRPYADDEINTLELQEPKSEVAFEDITTPEFMFARIFERFIWHKLYMVYGKSMFSASVEIQKSDIK